MNGSKERSVREENKCQLIQHQETKSENTFATIIRNEKYYFQTSCDNKKTISAPVISILTLQVLRKHSKRNKKTLCGYEPTSITSNYNRGKD